VGATLADPPPLPQRRLLFIGDSVTCGAGIDNWPACPAETDRPSNGYDAYGMLLGRRLDAQSELVCYGGRGVVRDYLGHRNVLNAPQFFNYSIPADDPTLQAKWVDDGWTPDAVVISLGTNDWNLQKTDPLTEDEFVGKYLGLVRDVRSHYRHAWIVLTNTRLDRRRPCAQPVGSGDSEAHERSARCLVRLAPLSWQRLRRASRQNATPRDRG